MCCCTNNNSSMQASSLSETEAKRPQMHSKCPPPPPTLRPKKERRKWAGTQHLLLLLPPIWRSKAAVFIIPATHAFSHISPGKQPEKDRERERDGQMDHSPNDMATTVVNSVGDEAHEADGATAVDQVYAPLDLHQHEPKTKGEM